MKKEIKGILGYKDMSLREFAEKIGWEQGNFKNQLARDDFRESALRQIAEGLDCDLKIQFVDKKTGIAYVFPESDAGTE